MARWLLLALVAAAGCDWRAFDEAVERAPVRSLTRPDGYEAPDIGKALLPLPPPPGQARITGRLLFAGTERPSLAVAEIDPEGRVTMRVAKKVELAALGTDSTSAIGSMALLGDGRILLGTPSYGFDGNRDRPPRGRTALLEIKGTGAATSFSLRAFEAPVEQRQYGLAVAAGNVSGDPGVPDHLVLSQTALTVLEDGDAARSTVVSDCALELEAELPTFHQFRALAAADLIAEGADEIAVGVPSKSGKGRVVIIQRGAMGLSCAATLSLGGSGERVAGFGASIAAADFDGDGNQDLLVGAPPDRAYLYAGPFMAPATSPPMPVRELAPAGVDAGATAGDFGLRVAAVDLDGSPGPEIVVSALSLPVGSKVGAGQVFVFRASGEPLVLRDSSPEENAWFGSALGELSLASPCAGSRGVLVVGAPREIFAFFRLPGTGAPPDPRCFPKM